MESTYRFVIGVSSSSVASFIAVFAIASIVLFAVIIVEGVIARITAVNELDTAAVITAVVLVVFLKNSGLEIV